MINKDYYELLNFTNIVDFNINIKEFILNNEITLENCFSNIFNFYFDDIVKKQLANSALHSISVLRPFVYCYDSFVDLIKMPIYYYKHNKGVSKGLKKGIKNMFVNFTTQGIFLGEKMYRKVNVALGYNQTMVLDKKSYYKRWMYLSNIKKRGYDNYFLKK